MKTIYLILFAILLCSSCSHKEEKISTTEIEQIKIEIIKRSEKHANDLLNLDYPAVMTFYADTVDFVMFGDGYYWGDNLTVDGIWKDLLGNRLWKKMLKWDLKNHKIFVHSRNAASYQVEFDHQHIIENGDTVMSSGAFTYGMQKIDGEWKAVTAHVSHIPARTNDKKWWENYPPSKRNK